MIEEQDRIVKELAASDARANSTLAGIVGAVIGFILGYFTWGIWPSWSLIVKMFNQCYFGG